LVFWAGLSCPCASSFPPQFGIFHPSPPSTSPRTPGNLYYSLWPPGRRPAALRPSFTRIGSHTIDPGPLRCARAGRCAHEAPPATTTLKDVGATSKRAPCGTGSSIFGAATLSIVSSTFWDRFSLMSVDNISSAQGGTTIPTPNCCKGVPTADLIVPGPDAPIGHPGRYNILYAPSTGLSSASSQPKGGGNRGKGGI